MLNQDDEFQTVQNLEMILQDLKSDLANEMVKLTVQPEKMIVAAEQERTAKTILGLAERILAIEKNENIY